LQVSYDSISSVTHLCTIVHKPPPASFILLRARLIKDGQETYKSRAVSAARGHAKISLDLVKSENSTIAGSPRREKINIACGNKSRPLREINSSPDRCLVDLGRKWEYHH